MKYLLRNSEIQLTKEENQKKNYDVKLKKKTPDIIDCGKMYYDNRRLCKDKKKTKKNMR
jgi:hypothetical protein